MTQSTGKKPRRKSATVKPPKPYPTFPLTPHASGAWQKKINGTVRYFGKWGKVVKGKLTRIEGDGWKEALELYEAQAADLHAGRVPKTKRGETKIADLCNRFFTTKTLAKDAGEITARTLDEYTATTDRIVAKFGKDRLVNDLSSEDFESLKVDLAKRYGPVRLGNEIQRVRTVFKYAYEAGLIDRPVRFGPSFVKPSKHVLRKHRASGGNKVFTSDEIRRLLKEAGTSLKAMILLGINCAFGNSDCGTLPLSVVDLKGRWIDYPRPKTGITRRCPLWPETFKAIKAAIKDRPDPQDERDADLVFITKYGRPWSREGVSDAITGEMTKLLHSLHINGRRGLGFYTLRHTFRTVADATKDRTAIRCIMGHSDDSMDANYTHGVEDHRLMEVAEHVHRWLFASARPKRK